MSRLNCQAKPRTRQRRCCQTCLTRAGLGSNSRIVKDFISFLAGAIFIEELLADDAPPPAASSTTPSEETPPLVDPDDDADKP